MHFNNKIVLVTGAGRGIGAAIAKAFAREGATVIVNYLKNHETAERVVAACKAAGGDAWSMQADVTSWDQSQAMVERVIAEAGKIDVLINNAFRPFQFDPMGRKLAWQLEWSDYQAQLDGSLKAVYNLCQLIMPYMQNESSGRIVNIVSNLIGRPVVPYLDYTTAKAAVVGFSQNLAAELGSFGITVNCVAPGLVYPTEASESTKENIKELIITQTPLRRIATPGDIAGPVLFLASEWSQFMTGQTLFVDGGFVMNSM